MRLVEPVRKRLTIPCEIVSGDEAGIVDQLGTVDVLVSMAFTKEMAAAGSRLRLVQVPGAGLDRIDRSALRAGLALANAYGHETGIAEYVIGAMIALTRSFQRLDRKLKAGEWESQWSVGTLAPPLWPELAGKTLGILGFGHIGEALARRAHAFDMELDAAVCGSIFAGVCGADGCVTVACAAGVGGSACGGAATGFGVAAAYRTGSDGAAVIGIACDAIRRSSRVSFPNFCSC